MNLYVRPEDLREELKLDTQNSMPVARLERVVERVCRAFDRRLMRRFYSEVATAEFNGNGGTRLSLVLSANEPFRGDLISVTTLKVDTTGDGTFNETLSEGTDYWLEIDNPSTIHRPATHLLIPTGRTTTPQVGTWPAARRRIEIAGKFGYSEETESTGLTGTVANGTATTLTASADASNEVKVGDTIIVESEQMYVSAVATTEITVTRGVNGTAAAAHSSKSILRRLFSADLREAVMMEAGRIYRQLATGFAGDVSSMNEQGYATFRASHPHIRELLAPYQRMTGVA